MTASLSETFEPPSTTDVRAAPGSSVSRGAPRPRDAPGRRRVRQPAGDVVHRGVLAVHGAERVVDVRASAEARRARSANAPRSASSLTVSPGVEAEVLQQQDLAVGQRRGRGLRRRRRRCRSRTATGAPSSSPRRVGDRGEGELRVRRALGAAEVRAHDDAGARVRRSAAASAGRARMRPSSVISPRALVERDVQVGAHEHAPTRDALGEQVVESLHSVLEPTSLTRSTRRLE